MGNVALSEISDALGQGATRQFGCIRAICGDPTGVGNEVSDGAQKCRLAGAVGPDEADEFFAVLPSRKWTSSTALVPLKATRTLLTLSEVMSWRPAS